MHILQLCPAAAVGWTGPYAAAAMAGASAVQCLLLRCPGAWPVHAVLPACSLRWASRWVGKKRLLPAQVFYLAELQSPAAGCPSLQRPAAAGWSTQQQFNCCRFVTDKSNGLQ